MIIHLKIIKLKIIKLKRIQLNKFDALIQRNKNTIYKYIYQRQYEHSEAEDEGKVSS